MADDDEPIDDEAAAEEWAAMAEEGGGDAASEDGDMSEEDMAAWDAADGDDEAEERILNQDEIDLLLGFDGDGDDDDSDRGIEAILGKALMAYEKLPMLEVVFDRLVRVLSSSLRSFTSDTVDVSIESMESLRFEDYLNSIPLPALLIVFRAVEWENFGLVTVESSLIYSVVDILLGGRRSSSTVRVEGRPYTTIEQDIVKRLVDVLLSDMSVAFDPLSPVTFQHERLENNPRFATITRPNNAVLLVKLKVEMEDRGGIIELLLPHTTLEPVRDMLMQIFMGETFGQDLVWEKHLGEELHHTDVDVQAVLGDKTITMGELVDLKVGSTMLLDCKPNSDIILRCGEAEITRGKLGRMGEKMAVSIMDTITDNAKKQTP